MVLVNESSKYKKVQIPFSHCSYTSKGASEYDGIYLYSKL
jgi:hypothetical protein